MGPTPVYDSWSSLGFDLEPEDIVDHAGKYCKPFVEYIGIQMGYVKDLSWLDMGALRTGIAEAGELLGSVERYRSKGGDQAILDLMDSRADEVCVSLRDHFGDISSARMTSLLLQHSKSGSMSSVQRQPVSLFFIIWGLVCSRPLIRVLPSRDSGRSPHSSRCDL